MNASFEEKAQSNNIKKEKVYFSSLKFYKSVTSISHIPFGANQLFN